MALTKEQFLATRGNLKVSTITVPGLDTVSIRELTTAQRGRLEVMMSEDFKNKEELSMVVPWVVSCCVMNGSGLMFTDKDMTDIGEMPSSVTSPIFDEALRISKLDEVGREHAKKKSKASR